MQTAVSELTNHEIAKHFSTRDQLLIQMDGVLNELADAKDADRELRSNLAPWRAVNQAALNLLVGDGKLTILLLKMAFEGYLQHPAKDPKRSIRVMNAITNVIAHLKSVELNSNKPTTATVSHYNTDDAMASTAATSASAASTKRSRPTLGSVTTPKLFQRGTKTSAAPTKRSRPTLGSVTTPKLFQRGTKSPNRFSYMKGTTPNSRGQFRNV